MPGIKIHERERARLSPGARAILKNQFYDPLIIVLPRLEDPYAEFSVYVIAIFPLTAWRKRPLQIPGRLPPQDSAVAAEGTEFRVQTDFPELHTR